MSKKSPVSPLSTRRDLLRKSEKELIKLCKKHNLSSLGNKGDLVHRLMKQNDPNYQINSTTTTPDNKNKKRTSKPFRRRSSSLPYGTLASRYKKSAKIKAKNGTKNINNIRTQSLSQIKSKKSSKNIQKTDVIVANKVKNKNIKGRNRSKSVVTLSKMDKHKKSKKKNKFKNKFTKTRNEINLNDTELNNNINIKNWSNMDVINWFTKVIKRKTSNKTVINCLKKYNITGNDMKYINELTLRMLGIDNTNDRKLVLDQIAKFKLTKTTNSNKQKHFETEIMRLQREITQLKKEKRNVCDIIDKSTTLPKSKSFDNGLAINGDDNSNNVVEEKEDTDTNITDNIDKIDIKSDIVDNKSNAVDDKVEKLDNMKNKVDVIDNNTKADIPEPVAVQNVNNGDKNADTSSSDDDGNKKDEEVHNWI